MNSPLTWLSYFGWVCAGVIYGAEWSLDYLMTLGIMNTYYTLGEYVFHRFTFHGPERFPRLSALHQKHHTRPTDHHRLFIPIRVTLLNDIALLCVCYLSGADWKKWMSCAHLSYLLFEMAHYGTHSEALQWFLPRRLIAFHHYHHTDSTRHYAFTTPYWDILCGTASHSFPWRQYPLSWTPLSILSFLSTSELQSITNLIYVYPVWNAYHLGWYGYAGVYGMTGIVSGCYHLQVQNRVSFPFLLRSYDYGLATLYFIISTLIWWKETCYSSVTIVWFLLSIGMYVSDRFETTHGITHLLWHLCTGVGVGQMIGRIPT